MILEKLRGKGSELKLRNINVYRVDDSLVGERILEHDPLITWNKALPRITLKVCIH